MLFCDTILLAGFVVTAAAQTLGATFMSSAQRTAVVELYTSEGCSSCPPADRWFSSLKSEAGLFRDFIPVAFHVDYWDDSGWKDRFASAAYSGRQTRYAQSGSVSQVYTPGVVLRGREWRSWSAGAAALHSDGDRVGPLELALDGYGHVTLRWWPTAAPGSRLLGTVVLLGSDLTTVVKRGENAGRELHHDFVVLGYSTGVLLRENDHYRVTLAVPSSANAAPRYAIAGWVSSDTGLAPQQAVGGWLAAPR